MTSLHIDKSIAKARRMGGFAGQSRAMPLWDMSKRELVELTLRLGALAARAPDSCAAGAEMAENEHRALKANGIL